MNNLTLVSPTMSSLEIAELTNKLHKNVLQDIRNMFAELEIDEQVFASTYVDAQGKSRLSFQLAKEHLLILLTGYSIPLRAKVIQRLEELESKQLPKTHIEAVEAFLLQLKSNKILEEAIEQQKPKVELADAFMNTNNSRSMGEVAKHFKLGSVRLFAILRDSGAFVYSGKDNVPIQRFVDQGKFEVKTQLINGVRHSTTRCLPKGEKFIAKLLKARAEILDSIEEDT